ncbi:MAG: hypothetical protein WC510_02000 [Candidatus Omnitrophota bacterium]
MSKDLTILNEYHPPQKLQRFVQVLFSEEVAGNKTEAERRTGVIKEKFYYHLKHNPDFRDWVNEQRKEYRVRNAPLVDAQLIAAIKKGDVIAMKLWYLLGGELKTPGLQLNQQFNIGDFDINKQYPGCHGCPNGSFHNASDTLLGLVIGILQVFNDDLKDEDLTITQMDTFIQAIKKRPFWFRKVLNEALKDALSREAEIIEGG